MGKTFKRNSENLRKEIKQKAKAKTNRAKEKINNKLLRKFGVFLFLSCAFCLSLKAAEPYTTITTNEQERIVVTLTTAIGDNYELSMFANTNNLGETNKITIYRQTENFTTIYTNAPCGWYKLDRNAKIIEYKDPENDSYNSYKDRNIKHQWILQWKEPKQTTQDEPTTFRLKAPTPISLESTWSPQVETSFIREPQTHSVRASKQYKPKRKFRK